MKELNYFGGVDQHKNYSEVAVLYNNGKIKDRKKLAHSDKEGMLNYFSELPKDKTRVVMEATGSWYWLADLLEEAGNIFNKHF